jgi:HlyD family secretion protein
LLPDMTANLTFQIERKTNALTIPNSAFRFTPKLEQVCQRDRPIVEALEAGVQVDRKGNSPNRTKENGDAKVTNDSKTHRNRNQKYVWIVEGDLLSAVPVEVGLNDKNVTEIVSGKLTDGQEVVIGVLK